MDSVFHGRRALARPASGRAQAREGGALSCAPRLGRREAHSRGAVLCGVVRVRGCRGCAGTGLCGRPRQTEQARRGHASNASVTLSAQAQRAQARRTCPSVSGLASDRTRVQCSRLSGQYPRGRCRERGYPAQRPRARRGLSRTLWFCCLRARRRRSRNWSRFKRQNRRTRRGLSRTWLQFQSQSHRTCRERSRT